MGIDGNNRADELAKKALSLSTTTNIRIPPPDIKRLLKEYYRQEWEREWRGANARYEIEGFEIGKQPAYFNLPRRDQIKITRIILSTTLLTHKHYFTKTPRPRCQECNLNLDLQHILIDCPMFEQHRGAIKQHCQEKDIPLQIRTIGTPKFPPKLVIDFLKKTSMYDGI